MKNAHLFGMGNSASALQPTEINPRGLFENSLSFANEPPTIASRQGRDMADRVPSTTTYKQPVEALECPSGFVRDRGCCVLQTKLGNFHVC